MTNPFRSLLAGLALAGCLFGTAVADPLSDGNAAYQRGDFVLALRLWQPLAEQGHPAAITNVGLLHYGGLGVPQSYATAARLWGRAAHLGYAPAQRTFGYMYTVGQGVPQDYAQAAGWNRLADAQGEATAMGWIASLNARNSGPPAAAPAPAQRRQSASQPNTSPTLPLTPASPQRPAPVVAQRPPPPPSAATPYLSPDAQTCQRYGYAPGATGFADCMMQIDIARQAQARASAEHNQRLAAYQQQVAQQERERRDERSMDMLMMGLRLMAGGSASGGSSGSAAPLPPPPQSTAPRTIRLPNGNQIYCQTIGNYTTCN